MAAGGLGILLILGGCDLLDGRQSAAAVSRSEAQPTANSMRQVFTEAFTDIQTYYLDPVKIGTLAIDGLAGIKSLDANVAVDRIDAKVRLVVKDTVAKVYDAPEDSDVKGWARLATAIVGDARDQSPKLHELDSEQFYRTVLQSALRDLDPFSRYAGHDLAQDNRAGRDGFGGIGVRLSFEGGQVKITDIQSDMPAGRAGLKVGDRLAKIDGRSL